MMAEGKEPTNISAFDLPEDNSNGQVGGDELMRFTVIVDKRMVPSFENEAEVLQNYEIIYGALANLMSHMNATRAGTLAAASIAGAFDDGLEGEDPDRDIDPIDFLDT
jgi:hypothetical protein